MFVPAVVTILDFIRLSHFRKDGAYTLPRQINYWSEFSEERTVIGEKPLEAWWRNIEMEHPTS